MRLPSIQQMHTHRLTLPSNQLFYRYGCVYLYMKLVCNTLHARLHWLLFLCAHTAIAEALHQVLHVNTFAFTDGGNVSLTSSHWWAFTAKQACADTHYRCLHAVAQSHVQHKKQRSDQRDYYGCMSWNGRGNTFISHYKLSLLFCTAWCYNRKQQFTSFRRFSCKTTSNIASGKSWCIYIGKQVWTSWSRTFAQQHSSSKNYANMPH